MAETYQATRDAVHRVVAPIVSKRPPRFRDPWYLEPEKGAARRTGLTPETGLDEAIVGFARRTGRTMTMDDRGSLVTVAPAGGRTH